ncbi:MAG: RnfABCDGE type electron transport complex subunit B [Deltaproteobacteria bacterium]|nr:RnfABCDGE type electron transport complex subunit B [Deltaproteobacteria bacterium]
MLEAVLIPAAVLGGLGGLLAVVLLVAARKFAVYEDPLVAAVEAALPNANCGACGFAGCHDFATKIVATRDEKMFCPPGGKDTAAKVGSLLGMAVEGRDPPVAVVMCRGSRGVANFAGEYQGLSDCRAATLVDGATKVCPYGCVGLGSCVKACSYDAIVIRDGVAVVLPERCIGDGACVQACPRGIIRMAPRDVRVYVACVSHDAGAAVRKYCKVGCIGCKRCVKACAFDAIQFDRNLARVDHDKCTACGACVGTCPQKVIEEVGLVGEAHAKAHPPPKEKKPAAESTAAAAPPAAGA